MTDDGLSFDRATVRFGAAVALDEVTLEFDSSPTAVLGPNGAGKTTLLNVATGFCPVDAGQVRWMGAPVTSPDELARRGLCRTFQSLALLESASVLDNVRLGAHTRLDTRWWQECLPWPSVHAQESTVTDDAMTWLARLGLEKSAASNVASLSFAERKIIGLIRAIVAKPRVLLLDEPSSGLGPEATAQVVDVLTALAERTQLVLVEHDVRLVERIAERVVLLDRGRVVDDGPTSAVLQGETMAAVYHGASA